MEEDKPSDLHLFNFLHKSNAQHDYHIYHKMFNRKVDSKDILDRQKNLVKNEYEIFKWMITDGVSESKGIMYVL